MYLVIMDTEHYSFIAVGETEEKAKRALVKKFNERAPKRATRKALEEWYGISVYEIKQNTCIRF